MAKEYTSIKVYIAGSNGENHICLKSDTLEGEKGMVELALEGENNCDKSLGFFDIEQLTDALNTIKNSKIHNLDSTES